MHDNEVTRAFRYFDLFADFSDEQLNLLSFVSEIVSLGVGDVLYSIDDTADGGYILFEGRLEAFDEATGESGDYDITAPALIGELGLLLTRPRSATIVASGPARLVFVPRESFLKLLRTDPALAESVSETLRDELARYLDSIARLAPRFSGN